MDVIGIICEYNPFHNGHIYHIEKIKELYPNSIIVAVISSSFTQRGNVSVLNKWDKTNLCLLNGVNLVAEIPFVYSTQSADVFAEAALKILNNLKVQKIVFGSECNDINLLTQISNAQINNPLFDKYVKEYLDLGNNYPTSLSLALKKMGLKKIDSPNDLLAISYIKEIIKNKYDIIPVSIKRTNNFHGDNHGKYLSATELRDLVNTNCSVKDYINYDQNIIYKNINYFNLLKYKIITSSNSLNDILTVDEGIDNRIVKSINNSNSLEDLINKIKTKRYTYNKINRMFIHILTNLTKEEAKYTIDYVRILGFDDIGKRYLNKIKNNTVIPIITKYKDTNSPLLMIEKRATSIYSLIVNDKIDELKKPIYKK